uniref:Uncharacterized protein n=1 Tax=Myoviridae sp. ctwwN25 TaxID=2825209 RepID=A0A8S5PND4_9CAUD|nr:MAG TPA: hypothetical protein [Myoviridae sp. ctwwN25]
MIYKYNTKYSSFNLEAKRFLKVIYVESLCLYHLSDSQVRW